MFFGRLEERRRNETWLTIFIEKQIQSVPIFGAIKLSFFSVLKNFLRFWTPVSTKYFLNKFDVFKGRFIVEHMKDFLWQPYPFNGAKDKENLVK